LTKKIQKNAPGGFKKMPLEARPSQTLEKQ